MKKIEKQLKNEGENFFPDNNIKNQIKQKLGIVENERRSTMKKIRFKPVLITALAVVLIMAIAIPTGIMVTKEGSKSYVSMDINPSFELILDKNDVVENVRPMNKEAVVIMEGVDFVGMSVLDAQNKIIDIAVATGYINENKTDNAIKIVAVNEKEKKENELQEKLNLNAQTHLGEKHIQCEVIGRSSNLSSDVAKSMGVSLGKLELVLEVLQKHPELATEEVKKMSVKLLNEILKNYDEIVIESTKKELQSEIAHKVQEAQKQYQDAKKMKDEVEKLMESIEKLAEHKKPNADKIKDSIDKFNALYPEYAYSGDLKDFVLIENYFDDMEDMVEKILEEKMELAEQKLIEAKKEAKEKYDSGNDDDDIDDDDDDDVDDDDDDVDDDDDDVDDDVDDIDDDDVDDDDYKEKNEK